MKLRANKHLGQHFLIDESVTKRIVEAISPQPGEAVIEIGPGLGALTVPVLALGVHLDAIEISTTLVEQLRQRFDGCRNLTLHQNDALKFDFAAHIASGAHNKVRIIGNLPYNISTPLLMRLFDSCEHIRDMHLMLQTEIVERIAAQPGARDYSRLSVATACFAEAQHLFDVAPSAFAPPPKVNSSLVRLIPRPCPLEPGRRKAFFDLVGRAFSQRRKTIGRIFAGTLNQADFARLGLSTGSRPETLSLSNFLDMLNLLRMRGWTTQKTTL